jgi:aryl-alcohol dehydrogenase-like predicted oxidoreductase
MISEIKPTNAEMEYLAAPFKASRIALGTWAMGGWMWGGTDEAEAIGAIHEAIDHGVTLIDTAPAYGFGRSEEIVGKALAEGGLRNRVLIATKVGLDWKDGQPFRSAGRTRIQKEIEDSLKRLRTDVIDIYQVHWPDPNVPIEETAAAMADLQRAGKIRAIGVSNFSPARSSVCAPTSSTSIRCISTPAACVRCSTSPPRPAAGAASCRQGRGAASPSTAAS